MKTITQPQTFCTTTFQTQAGTIENSYRCGQRRLSSAKLWQIRKTKRAAEISRPEVFTN